MAAITSVTQSPNTTAGSSIVQYTGSGTAGSTFTHGLGVAPSMVVIHATTTAGADQAWPVWHTSLANTEYVNLQGSAAKTTGATTYWNSTTPTSTVVTVGNAAAVNTSGDVYLAYVFAEVAGFSKFGSYTGNGAADGPFVWCGFKPRLVLVKRTDNTSDWYMWDTARDTYNVASATLLADTAGAESSATSIDALSNGFKCRSATVVNVSTATYIFAAFAEVPFKYSAADATFKYSPPNPRRLAYLRR